MTWLKKLYDTYESIAFEPEAFSPDDKFFEPYMHKLEKCHIEIRLDANGSFIGAKNLIKVVDGSRPLKYEGQETIIPVTPKSLTARTSGPAPYGLAEKIQYLSPAYPKFGGGKKFSVKDKKGAEVTYFDRFMEQLRGWCNSKFSDWKVESVLRYLDKGSLIEDLIDQRVVFVDESGVLLKKWAGDSNEKPDLFKINGMDDQGGLMIRWAIYKSGVENSGTWGDKQLISKWIEYQGSTNCEANNSVCMVLGVASNLANTHPKSLIQTKDAVGAKLVSSPTDEGYLTYQGRFLTESQAVQISSEVSQKAHNALRWLIRRQGELTSGSSAVISWATSGAKTPQPFSDPDGWGDDEAEVLEPVSTGIDHSIDLGKSFAAAFNKKLAGYRSGKKLELTDHIVVMALDSATPGRMAISYYRDFRPAEYFDNLEQWHLDFAWWQRASKEKQDQGRSKWFLAAPGLWAMLQAIYGDIIKSNETLKKSLAERMLPSILDKRPPPVDMVQRAFNRAIARHSYNKDEQWLWEQNLGVACALYRGFYARHPNNEKRRNYCMSLDLECKSRDYLFGRLLAIAERIEEVALWASGNDRPTTAQRFMQRFADRPSDTWLVIFKQLSPYLQQLKQKRPGFLVNISKELDSVMSLFEMDDFKKPDRLSPEFLLAFHCQRLELHQSNKFSETEKTTEEGTEA